MKYPLKYIFRQKALAILDVFTELFDIRIAFYSNDGKELQVGQHKPMCNYCNMLRNHLNFEHVCLTLDKKMRETAQERKKTVYYQCHGGMTEAVTPLYIEKNLIGFLMIGQFRIEDAAINRQIVKAWRKKYHNKKLEKAYSNTPAYPEEYTQNIIQLFEILVEHILLSHTIEFYGMTSLQPLISFIQDNLNERLDISEAAKIISQSKSSLSHKFKQVTGKSFKQFQIDLKLKKADEYFQKYPDIYVKEVAYRLGFSDAFYFSRLYKKHRGISPAQYKKQIKSRK